MEEPLVTIVVSPRERFSCASESLESIYEFTDTPFKLVYVDGNSPSKVQSYLQEQAAAKGFELIRKNYYLSPNHARNIGLAHVNTKYLVFIDNDVIVSPGWLKALVHCAEETEATVVGPLMCQEKPLHEIIHFAGGESHVLIDKIGRRRIREKMYKQGHRVPELRDRLQRKQTELAEFHCVLVRTEIFEKIGFLDEQLMNTKEHLDFCMTVAEAGGTIYFEPTCVVTYVPGPPLELSDLHYYMLRWSDAWTMTSLNRLREKWNLDEDGYFKTKYKGLGWRRRDTIIRPLSRRLTFGIKSHLLEKWLTPVDKAINRYLTDRYTEKQRQLTQQQTPLQLPKSPKTALSSN
ncbi:glycosyltransferase family 2 protein [Aerosakkonemataceae cyanobacterium BLCC-F154]|uniref:Glycosyltransferase family 2 protein n=1 Tax=Floridaenema fluviatile BLCC-F154 TaxID=3153640 RepID=A0ABV4YAA9_9CYAN